MKYFFLLVTANLSIAASCWLSKRFALLDHPDERKRHESPTPHTGGVAIVSAMTLYALWWPVEWPRSVVLGGFGLLILGVVDDLCGGMRARLRFVLQLSIIATSLSGSDLVLFNLGALLGDQPLGLGSWALTFTTLSVCGLLNSLNLLDGQDGLAIGIGVGAWVIMALISFLTTGGIIEPLGALITLGIAFLFWNARYFGHSRASIFLGDGGAYVLGYALGISALQLGTNPAVTLPPVVVAYVVAFPILSTLTVSFMRIFRGVSPFHADRLHLHHLLTDKRGWTVTKSTGFLILLNFLVGLAGFGLWLWGVSEQGLFYVLIFALVPFILLSLWSSSDDQAAGVSR